MYVVCILFSKRNHGFQQKVFLDHKIIFFSRSLVNNFRNKIPRCEVRIFYASCNKTNNASRTTSQTFLSCKINDYAIVMGLVNQGPLNTWMSQLDLGERLETVVSVLWYIVGNFEWVWRTNEKSFQFKFFSLVFLMDLYNNDKEGICNFSTFR